MFLIIISIIGIIISTVILVRIFDSSVGDSDIKIFEILAFIVTLGISIMLLVPGLIQIKYDSKTEGYEAGFRKGQIEYQKGNVKYVPYYIEHKGQVIDTMWYEVNKGYEK